MKWNKHPFSILLGVVATLVLLSLEAPRNGSGSYTLPAGNPVTSGSVISSTVHNATMADIRDALTQSVSKDGQTELTGNLNVGANSLVNVAGVCATTSCGASSMLSFSGTTMQLGTGSQWTSAVFGGVSFTGVMNFGVKNTSTTAGDTARIAIDAGSSDFQIGVCNQNQAALCKLVNGPTTASAWVETFNAIPMVFGTNNLAAFKIDGSTQALSGWGPTAAAFVDMTPDISTFTGTFTGSGSGSGIGIVEFYRIGKVVYLDFTTMPTAPTGASESMTGLPPEITPSSRVFTVMGVAITAAPNSPSLISATINTNGSIVLGGTATPINGAAAVNSTLSYLLP